MLLVPSQIKPGFIRRLQQEKTGGGTKGIVVNRCEDGPHCAVSPLLAVKH